MPTYLPTLSNRQKAYRLWISNVFHRSLHFKKVGKNVWSVRITENYRALALKKVKIITGFGLVLMMSMKS